MKRLTRAEEDVMQAVWSLGGGSSGDVREVLAKAGNEAKPTTINTVLRILCDKGFLRFTPQGRGFHYEPAVAKTDYSATRVRSLIQRFFGGSPAQLVSFLAEREDLSLAQIEGLLDAAGESGADANSRPDDEQQRPTPPHIDAQK